MPPKKIFGISKQLIKGGDIEDYADKVKALSASGRIVTSAEVAQAMNVDIEAAELALNLTARMDLIQRTQKGWIAS